MMVYSQSYVAVDNTKLEYHGFRNEMIMQTYIMENEDILLLDIFDSISVHGFEVPWKTGETGGRIDLLV